MSGKKRRKEKEYTVLQNSLICVGVIVVIYINIFFPGQQAEKARRGEEQRRKAGRQARSGEENAGKRKP